jgi:hypothetical protein
MRENIFFKANPKFAEAGVSGDKELRMILRIKKEGEVRSSHQFCPVQV